MKTSKDASESLRELDGLCKRLAAVRGSPRVVGVKGATTVKYDIKASNVAPHRDVEGVNDEGVAMCSSSAGTERHKQQVHHARLEKEWREGQGRASRALSNLEDGANIGEINFACLAGRVFVEYGIQM